VKVICHPTRGKSKGFGFVTFSSQDEAAAAAHKMNGEASHLSSLLSLSLSLLIFHALVSVANTHLYCNCWTGARWEAHSGALLKQWMICHCCLFITEFVGRIEWAPMYTAYVQSSLQIDSLLISQHSTGFPELFLTLFWDLKDCRTTSSLNRFLSLARLHEHVRVILPS
jgi:RNA recognition motif-containing protein